MRKKKKLEEGDVEANLIPVMNVMFLLIPALLLAMEVASFASITVSPPKESASAQKPNEEKKDEKRLNLKVFVLEDGFRVVAAGQQDGAEAGAEADSKSPTIGLTKPGTELTEYDRWDYDALEKKAKEYKAAYSHETAVTISAENTIPMQALVRTMDALRGRECKLLKVMTGGEEPGPECFFFNPIIQAGAG